MSILICSLSCLCIVLSGLLINTTFKYVRLIKDYDIKSNNYNDLKMKYDKLEVDNAFYESNFKIIKNQLQAAYDLKARRLKNFYERKENIKAILTNLEEKIKAAPFECDEEIQKLTDVYLKLLKEYKEDKVCGNIYLDG